MLLSHVAAQVGAYTLALTSEPTEADRALTLGRICRAILWPFRLRLRWRRERWACNLPRRERSHEWATGVMNGVFDRRGLEDCAQLAQVGVR